MTTYPGAIDEFRTTQNLPGILYNAEDTTTVFAEDSNNHSSAIVAIETTLGVEPAGDAASVADRLDAIESVQPYVSVVQSGVQTIPTGSATRVNLQTVESDEGSLWNTSTSVGLLPIAGMYYCEASVWYGNAIDTPNNKIIVYSGGREVCNINKPKTDAYENILAARTFPADANDTIELYVQQDTGGDCYLEAYPATVYLTYYRVGSI